MGLAKAAILWIGVNLLTAVVIRLSGRRAIRISYNRLCEDPAFAIRQINAEYALDIDPEHALERVNESTFHCLGGNLMRFKKIEAIRRDESWRSHIRGFRRLWLNILLWPCNMLWVRRSRYNVPAEL
jgi:hypothetical protein